MNLTTPFMIQSPIFMWGWWRREVHYLTFCTLGSVELCGCAIEHAWRREENVFWKLETFVGFSSLFFGLMGKGKTGEGGHVPTTGYFTHFPLSVFLNLCISHLRYLGHYVYSALVTVFFAFRGLRFSTFVFLSIGLLCYHDQVHRPYFLLYFCRFFHVF
jgi:hypothetical protein